MKKLLHKIFCYKIISVKDANTGQLEKARYTLLFGWQVRIRYRPDLDSVNAI